MKRSSDVSILQTNLLQALQKNKIIQGKLAACQSSYYIQLLKDMQVYQIEEKYNRELLYTWKKESYIRQLQRNLQEYEQKQSGVKDAYYESQVRSLDNIITGQQTLVIPPSEEERRLNINAKYQRFLQKNPLQSSSSRFVNSAIIPTEPNKNETNEEEENPHRLEKTWQHIHAQSATSLRRKQNNMFPNIHRSATTPGIRRKKSSTKSFISPTIAAVSNVRVATTPEVVTFSSDENFQRSPRSPTKSSSNNLGLPGGIEPLLLTSEALDKYTGADLFTMRSVRRPRKSPSDLNLLFETRKRIYQINKQALDHQFCQRKFKLPINTHFDLRKQIDSTNNIQSLIDKSNENIEKQDDGTIII